MTNETTPSVASNATCTSRRRVVAGAGAMALATAALSMRRVLAQDGTPVASPGGEEPAGPPSWLFTQTFTSGYWEPTGDPALFALHLSGGLASTVGFTDRPYRDFMIQPTADMIPLIWDNADNPPNAAIIVENEGTQYTFILVLNDPAYDAATDTVHYTVSVLDAYEGDGLGAAVERVADGTLPQSFGAGALFIDSLGCRDSTKGCQRISKCCDNCPWGFGYFYSLEYAPGSEQLTNTCFSFPEDYLIGNKCNWPCDKDYYNNWCDATFPEWCYADGYGGCKFASLEVSNNLCNAGA